MIRFALALTALLAGTPTCAQAQHDHNAMMSAQDVANALRTQGHAHPPEDEALHEKFYSSWMMPDNPARSCCNKADCYPTEARFHHGHWQARRREDGKWLFVPEAKIEQRRDSPDGRNHLCAPPPSASYPPDTVFCFSLGSGT
jgi:hypothetical protein